MDVAEAALDQARARCAGLPGVRFERMAVPDGWPEGALDLVVFSEVLYYLGAPGLRLAARRTVDSLAPGGCALLVNWRGPTGGACTGDEAAEGFIAAGAPALAPTVQHRTERYRLDLLEAAAPR